MKKLILFCFLTAPLFLGCATTIPRATKESRAEVQAKMARFEEAKALSPDEIPDVYDVSRLAKGSNVKTKHTHSGKPYFITKTVRDIKTDNKNKIYVVDSIIADRTLTFESDSASLRKTVTPYKNTQPMADFKGLPEDSNVETSILQGVLQGGVLGVVLNVLDFSRMKDIKKDITAQIKSTRIETKVIDFKFLSEETLKIGDKNIPCKVYEVQSLTRQTRAPSKRMPAPSVISEESERIWVSEEVPFGVAKRESTQTFHILMEEDSRSRMVIEPTTQTTQETTEVVEFSY